MVEILTAPKVRTPWLPYQRAWMNDDAPLKIAEKSRRIGWTYVEAYDVTSQRFRSTSARNMDHWFSSADESAAAEFIEYVRFFAHDVFGRIADFFTEQVEDPDTKRTATAFNVRCPNGRRITAMSSNPRRFRSKGGDVTLDEYGYHDRAREMYKAAQPSTMRGGRMRVFSTHNGEESEFNRFCGMAHQILRAAGQDPSVRVDTAITYEEVKRLAKQLKVMPWKLHRVTLLDAVAQGLVENINHFQGAAFTRDDFIDKCQSECVDDDMWNQEFMCVPSVGTAALLPYELIEACERDTLAFALLGLDTDRLTGGPLYIGMDIARRKDLTVLWLLERVGAAGEARLVTRAVKWMEKAPFRVQYDALRTWLKLPNVRRCCIDATGMGMQLAEDAVHEFGSFKVEAVTFSGPVKEELAMPLRRGFEDRSILIPSDTRIREGLHKIRKTTTASGNLRFEAERDEAGHADEFWALALGKHAAGELGDGKPVDPGSVCSAPQTRDRADRRGPSAEAVFENPRLARAAARGHRSVGV